MTYPLVSIIIPTYNYACYILDAINSVFEQDYPLECIEIIVVDDGSTDNTEDVLRDLIESNRIKYFYQENKGKASATRMAIEKSKGEIIFNLDADDYFLPGKIRKTVVIYECENVVHVANPAKFVIDGKDAGQEEFPREIMNSSNEGIDVLLLFYNNRILYGGGSTFSARADVLKSVFIPDDVDMYIDEFLILAVLARGRTYFLDEPLSVWRGHNSNYTVKKLSVDSKSRRMLDSSSGVLKAVQQDPAYPESMRRLYALQHHTRILKLKEEGSTKTIGDIVKLISVCFIENRYSIAQLKKYAVLNRMLPTTLINLLKGKKRVL